MTARTLPGVSAERASLPRRVVRLYDRDEARLLVEAACEGRPGLVLLDAPPEPGRAHVLELRAANASQPQALLTARVESARVGALWVARFVRPTAASRERMLGSLRLPDGLLGRRLAAGRYQLLARLGEGGGGLVYRAWDAVRRKAVALKLCDPAALRVPALRRQFRIESFVASLADHPSLVRGIDAGVDDSFTYLALELVSGPSLQTLLEREGPWSVPRALACAAQVIGALAELHALGVVHRDVKPANILLRRDGRERRAVLCDYGTALLVGRGAGDGDAEAAAAAGMLWGTPEYMAPEQVAATQVDARADVFACGVLLYQLLTGRLPWEGDDPLEVARRRLWSPPSTLRQRGARVGTRLEDIVMAALRVLPDDRPGSATELLDALLGAVGHPGPWPPPGASS